MIILFVLSTLFPVTDIFAPPSPNEWSRAPYCPGGCPLDFMKQRWSEYYDYKGSDWMELKKQEMLFSMNNGTLADWFNTDPSRAHYNVFNYYFYKGEIPNQEGKFIDQVEQEIFLTHLENNQFPLGEHMFINFTVLLTIVSGAVIGIVFVVWRIRK